MTRDPGAHAPTAGNSAARAATARLRRRRLAPGRALALAAMLLAALALASGARAGWLAGKAVIAQHLLERAWRTTLVSGSPTRPWPWADVTPVARLHILSLDRSLIVLEDASGEALAFGPGLVAGSPARAGVAALAIGGHRDSHLAFLEHLDIGAEVVLETRDGSRHSYRLADTRIVDSAHERFAIARDRPGLVLITCYPFRASQTGGPLRHVAIALPAARTWP